MLEPDLESAGIVTATVDLKSSDMVLDYGCGSGALAAALAPLVREFVGVDGDSSAIDRCRGMTDFLPNARFEAFQLSIPEVTPKIGTAVHLSFEELASKYEDRFDLVCSLERFARLAEQEAARALRLFGRVLKRNGYALLGCCLDTIFAPSDRVQESGAGPLANAVPISLEKLNSVLIQENFRPVSVVFGTWRTQRGSRSLQQHLPDLVLAMRQSNLPANFSAARYLELHADVLAANIDPVEHYLVHGFYEGRQTS